MSHEPTYYEARKAWRRQQERRRRGRPTCEHCGREIVFVRSAKNRHKKIPCDPALDYGDGQRTLVTLTGRTVAQAGEDVLGREPHFGTCPLRRLQRLAERAWNAHAALLP